MLPFSKVSRGKNKLTELGLAAISAATVFFSLWLVDFHLCSPNPGGFYGFQTDALLSGQLHLKITPNPELAKLQNPYDGNQNYAYRILDLSYYKGRYYSYFGIGPILLLTAPWRLLTHTYLTEPGATAVFLLIASVLSLFLLRQLRSWHGEMISGPTLVTAYALVNLGGFGTIHLVGVNAGTVAQYGAYVCVLAALLGAAKALTGRAPLLPLAVASLFCGLAVACRPTFLPVVGLLPPVVFFGLCHWRRTVSPARLLAAAILPVTVSMAGIFCYNYARFDSIFEFGNRYQLTGRDYRTVRLFSVDYIWPHLKAFVFRPFELQHYFPFFMDRHDLMPVGFLWACPASLLAGGLLFSPGADASPARRAAGVLALGILFSFAGVLVFLAAFLLFLFHYEVDFLFLLTWVAVTGWFAALAAPQIPEWVRKLVGRLGGALCVVTIFINVFWTLGIIDYSARCPAVANLINRAVDRVDRARGVSYGPVRLSVKFPESASERNLPLLTTGYDHNDLIYARVGADSSVQIGFFHAGIGGPLSEPIKVDLRRVQQLQIFSGALLPPPAHPFFQLWSPAAVFAARHTLEVKLEDRQVLLASVVYYENSPGNVLIGANPGLSDVAMPLFPGSIAEVDRPALDPGHIPEPPAVDTGAVALQLRLPPGDRTGGIDPLLSMGGAGAGGELVYISYLANSMATLGVNFWGGGSIVSEPFLADPQKLHRLVIFSDALARGTRPKTRLALAWDGESVLYPPDSSTQEQRAGEVYYGINAIGSGICGVMFGGTILGVTPLDPPAEDFEQKRAVDQAGTILLSLFFPAASSRQGQPLVVSGEAGKADIVYVLLDDAEHVRFGFDHWGTGGEIGKAVKFDPKARHTIAIDLGSVHALAGPPAAQNGSYRVTMDGQMVLNGTAVFYPADLKKIFIGENPAGGSTAGSRFLGRIFDLKVIP